MKTYIAQDYVADEIKQLREMIANNDEMFQADKGLKRYYIKRLELWEACHKSLGLEGYYNRLIGNFYNKLIGAIILGMAAGFVITLLGVTVGFGR